MTSHLFPNGLPKPYKKELRPSPKSKRQPHDDFEWFCGEGRLKDTLLRDIDLAASTSINVLIIGETGTGKEVVAKWIHETRRAQMKLTDEDAPFVPVNCAAVPENLMESILFGHERGAFTSARDAQKGKFELAKKGTLFLDEIQNLNLSSQSKLLRVVQTKEFERLGARSSGEVECKIITASNVPLELLIEKSHFRKDLYYRLNICPIYLPPLRSRKEDLPKLIKHYIKDITKKYQISSKDICPIAFETLLNHQWPGNLRELEHCLLYALMRSKGDLVRNQDLPASLTGSLEIYLQQGAWADSTQSKT